MAISVRPAPPRMEPVPFRWSQLESKNDYRIYVRNLRAAGCPESTIEDIVRGNAARAFAWKRRQLGLDGSGNGSWSRSRELQVVAYLLGEQSRAAETPTPSQSTGTSGTSYPLFLQNANWRALGFNEADQAAIAQVRQQFLSQINGQNQEADGEADPNSNGTAHLTRWQTAQQNADAQLRDLLGAQGYMAYEQQQYYAWYQPQVTANGGSGNLTINPDAFSLK